MPTADPTVHYDIEISTADLTIENFKTVLLAGGWSLSDSLAASQVGTFSSGPSADTTYTINGTTFTLRVSPSGSFEFGFGADGCGTFANLVTAINAVMSATVVATSSPSTGDAGTVTITSVSTGTSGNSITVSSGGTGNTLVWGGGTLTGGGYKLRTADYETTQGFIAHLFDNGGPIHLLLKSADESLSQDSGRPFRLGYPGGGRLRVIAWPNGYAYYDPGVSPSNSGRDGFADMIAVADAVLPLAITNVQDDGGGLVEITLDGTAPITGTQVKIAGVLGASGANGTFTFTNTGANTGTLDGSTFGGSYTSGGALAGPGQIEQAWFACGSLNAGNNPATFRGDISAISGVNVNDHIAVACARDAIHTTSLSGSGIGRARFIPAHEAFGTALYWWDGRDIGSEALVVMNPSNPNVAGALYGEAINCLVKNVSTVASDFDADEPFTTSDGDFWWRFTHNGSNAGTLCIRVPATAGSPPTATITSI